MIKVFALAPNENWIVDRFVQEWCTFNDDISVERPEDADTIWLMGAWCWRHIDTNLLSRKNVVATVHHLVPEKFGLNEKNEFVVRDQFVTMYHVPCKKTAEQIRHLTNKPIFVCPFWVNQQIWFEISDKNALRKKYGLSENAFLVGSFQRDTEGNDLSSPKLEKGPDLFCDFVEKMKERSNQSIEVVLSGWRRQYVINRLRTAGISFKYFEMVDFGMLNELYNMLDLYAVTSRHEGGPQAIVECALTRTPIISTDVGIASLILDSASMFDRNFDAVPNVDYAYAAVQQYMIPAGMSKFREMFVSL